MEDSNTRLLRLSVHGSLKSEAEENVDKIIFSQFSIPGKIIAGIGKWWSNRQKNPHVQPVRSMVVSVTGNYMAIIDGYRIHFLSRANGFSEPVGYSKSSLDIGFYTFGVWMQESSTFAAMTSLNYLVVFDINGKQLNRAYIRRWKADSFAVAMFIQNISTSERNDSYMIAVFASDCTLHLIEYGSGSFYDRSTRIISHALLKNIYPQGVICCDFNYDKSILAVAGRLSKNNGGCYRLSLWRIKDFWKSLHLLESIDLEDNGTVMTSGKLIKLIMSPGCQYICFIDSRARPRFVCMKASPVWALEEIQEPFSDYGREPDEEVAQYQKFNSKQMLKFSCFEVPQYDSVCKGKKCKPITGIKEACWWSDDTLAVLTENGSFAIASVHDLGIISQFRGEFSYDRMHIIHGHRRYIFILEVTEKDQIQPKEMFEHCNLRLISFQEYTRMELFKTLLRNAEFDFALLLANVCNLNPETVYKHCWLNSTYELQAVEENLSQIIDKDWVLQECLEKVCPTLDAMNKLLHHGLSLVDLLISSRQLELANVDTQLGRLCLIKLRLLQYHDRLETYLGINMGRYNANDYRVFRESPLSDVAVIFAESGKIGALCLLFKRHIYSLTPHLFEILDAIPETVAPYTYAQLLPGLQVSDCYIIEREKDWVEEHAIVNLIQKQDIREVSVSRVSLCESTEHVVKAFIGYSYPSDDAITMWYKKRTMEIDKVSGQLENALALLDLGKQKGCRSLEDLLEDLSRFLWVIYTKSEADDVQITLSFQAWQRCSGYDKFELMLRGVNEGTVLDRLKDKAIPFMKHEAFVKDPSAYEPYSENEESLLVKWMKDIAQKNQLQICDAIFMEECKATNSYSLFDSEIQCIRTGLDCVYACTGIDQWDLMTSVISKLSMTQTSAVKKINISLYCKSSELTPIQLKKPRNEWLLFTLEKEVQQAIGHVEAGRLLSQYQVPKPIGFFKTAQNEEAMVKQLVILILSKFSCRQSAPSDSEWVSMWDDLQALQYKAFSFLNKQFLFVEYYKSLLKAGKFYLAKSQLHGVGNGLISVEKAESIIIQVAREYFYAASSLHSPEIEKARLCLNLSPSSKNIAAETALIDVVTKKLPALGVILSPMQVKQLKDPMEIIRKALMYTSTSGGLQVDDLLDIAWSLGMSSDDHIAMVEEAIAREAAASGEITLALNLCLSLIERRYGPIWDLCAALGRGPEVEELNLKSRKLLIGFALGHCDQASIGQLLNSWKEIDLSLRSTEIKRALRIHSYLDCAEDEIMVDGGVKQLEEEGQFIVICEESLHEVALNQPAHDSFNRNFLSKDRHKMLSRLIVRLPELLQTAKGYSAWQNFQNNYLISKSVSTILLGLGHGGVLPNDEMICYLAQVAMSEGRSLVGFGYLLNLTNCRKAVEFFEKDLGHREEDEELCDTLELAFKYGTLQNAGQICGHNPIKRKEVLLKILTQSLDGMGSVTGDTDENNVEAESQCWKQWQSTILEVLNMYRHRLEPKPFI